MSSYLSYVQSIADGFRQASKVSAEEFVAEPVVSKNKKVALFSPHPDDECIIGLLPLRLQHEQDYQVVNVPMTFGSNPRRKEGRLAELEQACEYLGWSNYRVREDLENLTVEDVMKALAEVQPDVIVFPHDDDWNSRHIEVHHVLMKALAKMPDDFTCLLVETEFWGAMDTPNTHLEASVEHVSELLTATAYHVEEVARNPYHLRLPAWMEDNVRRGAELVGGQGQEAPDFLFSTLYRMQIWKQHKLKPLFEEGQTISCGAGKLNLITQWKSS